jgi:Spy/CpxP family protein refolding chaperone
MMITGALGVVSLGAQTAPATPAEPGVHAGRGGGRARLLRKLNLTPDQQMQARQIFQDARSQSGPVREQMKQLREQLRQAAKSGAGDATIDQLARQEAPLAGQLAAIRAKAFEKFYAVLNADQKQQLDAMPHLHAGRRQARG